MRGIEAAAVLFAVSFGAFSLPACGGTPVPPPTVANAEAGIRAARELGAPQDPQGALHLSLAQEELEKAKKLYTSGDPKNGDLVLGMAAADADLALAEAKAAQSRTQTQQIMDQAKLLKAQH
jgi:hypothetical protein